MSLINRKALRRFIIDKAQAMRPGMFTRVSGKALDEYEARIRAWVIDDIQRHPSIGKTFVESSNGAIVNKRSFSVG